MLAKAIAVAAEAHGRQRDKRDEPYILHPIRVALALKADGYTEVFQVIAVLHDVVEDTTVTLEDIQEKFQPQVTRAIEALTRRVGENKEPYKEYIIRCCNNPLARVVKRYDIYDNLDPKRWCEGVPVSHYSWALGYIQGLDDKIKESLEHGVFL